MPLNVPYNGNTYTIPLPGENYAWGAGVTSYLNALAVSLNPNSGAFTLAQELDFGSLFGVKTLYLKSRTSNTAAAGILRLARTDSINFRNAANTADLPLGVNSSNQLTFNGAVIPPAGTFDYIDFNTAYVGTGAVGRMIWNDTDGTLDLGMKGGNVTLQVGQEQLIRIRNNTGVTLTESQVVRINGSVGQRPTVTLAQADTVGNSVSTIAVVTEPILNNAEGYCTTSGSVRNLNTTGFVEGDLIYLSSTVAGGYTKIAPTAPNFSVPVGWITKADGATGSIFVNVQPAVSLTKLSDVQLTSPLQGQQLVYDNASSTFKNSQNQTSLLTVTATSGGSTTMNNTYDTLIMDIAGTIGNYTVTLPASPSTGRIVILSLTANSAAGISSFTVNAAATVKNAPTSMTAGTGFSFQYTGSVWARLY